MLNESELDIGSVKVIHTILHPTFQLAVRDNIIRNNPTDGVLAELCKKTGKKKGARHAMTLEQQRAFMSYTADHPIYCRWMPLFTVLLGTGCRIGEVLGLRWEDVDMEKRMISINHTVSYVAKDVDKKAEFIVSRPKTEAGIRTIPMMDAVLDAFQEEYEFQKENGIKSPIIGGMTGFVFCNRRGNIHNPRRVNVIINEIRKHYNDEEGINAQKENRQPVLLPYFTCHHLRHTFCTRLCECETNMKVIQDVMGHSDITTTMNIYAEVTDSKKKEAIENLSMKLDVF
jgi:integrase